MKGYRKWLLFFFAFLVILVLLIIIALPYLNSHQEKGVLKIPGLKQEVKVLRDEKGMAYIYAGNTADAFLAHGFLTAQDRLFQMELAKLYATGRICELIGDKGEPVDTRMRTIGFHRQGKRQAEILNPAEPDVFPEISRRRERVHPRFSPRTSAGIPGCRDQTSSLGSLGVLGHPFFHELELSRESGDRSRRADAG